MSDPRDPGRGIVPASNPAESVAAFVAMAKAARPGEAKGRVILALDATLSRQPTWDLACDLQAKMFDAVAGVGGLDVQLVYFRGLGECRSSRFVRDAAALKSLMERIDCRGGHTQIGKVLSHTLAETARGRVGAVIYIGDALEERLDALASKAGDLGLRGVPLFIFQEGADPAVMEAFGELARLSRGARFSFDRSAPGRIAGLLGSIAVFASGGRKALAARGSADDRLLLASLGGGSRP